ncbi:MAG: hypothetical protein JO002_09375 [Burkholderiaceae bacterium]|nr:hypothetical protein [Burkholderiaceae bacterium]
MQVEIAPGELVDKITILAIKRARIADAAKLKNVEHEYCILTAILPPEFQTNPKLGELQAALQAVNEIIWQVEDDIRDHERRKDFGPSFVELARAVYINNDQRAALKREINVALQSAIVEEKSYAAY